MIPLTACSPSRFVPARIGQATHRESVEANDLIGRLASIRALDRPLAGLTHSLTGQLPVTVVDGVSSAVRHAESLVALTPGRATRGSFAPPPHKPHRGLSEAMAKLLAG